MHAYVALLLMSCLASAVFATAILARDSSHSGNRLASVLIFGCCFWAGCEVLWNTATEANTALLLMKLSTLGWLGIGPIALHLIAEVTSEPHRRLRRALPVLYTISLIFLMLQWLTPWLHAGAVRMSWGWAYRVGPAFPVCVVFCLGTILWAASIGYRAYLHSPLLSERRQARWIGVGSAVAVVLGVVTDAVLPFLGVYFPHLATAGLSLFAGTVAWSLYYFGYSVLAPGGFARQIFETMPEGIAVLYPDGRIRSANEGLARLSGYPCSELIRRSIGDLLTARFDQPSREVVELDCELVPATGRPFPVSVSAVQLRDKQQLAMGVALVVRDLREIVTLRQRLMVSSRMAAVGQLAAGVAHEINNPMAYVQSNLALLLSHWEKLLSHADPRFSPEDRKELLSEGMDLIQESLEGVQRTTAIVSEIRNFSHSSSPGRERVDLWEILDSVERVVATQLGDRIRIERQFGELPPVYCAAREIQQVFVNLVLNAADAIDERGVIRFRTARDGNTVRVFVEDSGCGIDPETLEKIFDPFFTTKAVGEGTGLGLALSYEILRRHGGDIVVSSHPGEGTTFCVNLPIDPRVEGSDRSR